MLYLMYLPTYHHHHHHHNHLSGIFSFILFGGRGFEQQEERMNSFWMEGETWAAGKKNLPNRERRKKLFYYFIILLIIYLYIFFFFAFWFGLKVVY